MCFINRLCRHLSIQVLNPSILFSHKNKDALEKLKQGGHFECLKELLFSCKSNREKNIIFYHKLLSITKIITKIMQFLKHFLQSVA